jgi:hypothetical protein
VALGARDVRRLAALFPDLLGEPDPDVSLAAAEWLSAYLGRVPRLSAIGLGVGIRALLWLPVVFVGRPVSADRLSTNDRARYFARWSGSRVYWVREVFFLVKGGTDGLGLSPDRARASPAPARGRERRSCVTPRTMWSWAAALAAPPPR